MERVGRDDANVAENVRGNIVSRMNRLARRRENRQQIIDLRKQRSALIIIGKV